ncbi:MAG: LacI family DNA-binding transcriptional regulator [Phycisphaerae bacterium]|nr:LacI family DNA-binding transcriptional regulator [Phycisphaerae bacterium]
MPDAGKRKTRPTIQAIAEEAGVSRATVSLILANRPEVIRRFRPETVDRVRRIAEEQGYAANLMAISLRSGHPTFYGLILRGRGDARAQPSSWHVQALEGQFLAGAMEASRVLDLYPVLASLDSPEPEAAVQRVRGVLDGGVFGAILRTPPTVLDDPMRRQIELGLPVVIVFPEHPTTCPSNAIDVNNLEVGQIAARLLRDAGRRKWVIVSDDFFWEPIRLRKEGALSVAREAGIEVELLEIPLDVGERGAMAWLTPRLRDMRPDGVYAASSVASVGALHAGLDAGFRIPQEVCLVGCDASFWRAPGWQAITSVDVSWYEAGELAVRKMVELQSRAEFRFENLILPPMVRTGGTCPVSG